MTNEIVGPVYAWHFLAAPAAGEPPRLGYDDRRAVVVGETLTVNPDRIKVCAYGLHASEDILDALTYERGSLCCRVRLSGRIIKGDPDEGDDDKHCASERTVLAMVDIRADLIAWARWVLTTALDRQWPDAPACVRDWTESGEYSEEAEFALGPLDGDLAYALYVLCDPYNDLTRALHVASYLAKLGISRDEARANLFERIAPLFADVPI